MIRDYGDSSNRVYAAPAMYENCVTHTQFFSAPSISEIGAVKLICGVQLL